MHAGYDSQSGPSVSPSKSSKDKLARWPAYSTQSSCSLSGQDSYASSSTPVVRAGSVSSLGLGLASLQLPTLKHPSASKFIKHTASISDRPATPLNIETHPSTIPSLPPASSSVLGMNSEFRSTRGAWPSCDSYLEEMAQSSSLDKAVSWEEAAPDEQVSAASQQDAGSEDQVHPASSKSQAVCQERGVGVKHAAASKQQRGIGGLRVSDEVGAAAAPISADMSEECFTAAAKPAFYIPEEPILAELIGAALN